ncbi:uncharacterized protein [Brachionichthys hirsutus]|uniref:uncharacterized protein n=1 Tax=Brachionichthys hirsutus TaxID=412623 RepID=UPI003604C247
MEYELILAVSGFPSLYDSTCLTYRDTGTRSDAWRQVAAMVGVSESECRRKWKMLRDQHRRERQREKERRESGAGLLNYRPWRFSAILSFLNPFIDARAAGGTGGTNGTNGTNGCVLDPIPARLQGSYGTTTETRSADQNAGVALADATTTTLEVVHRKRPSSFCGAPIRATEVKTEAAAESAVTDDCPQTQHVNVRELFDVMMQSVTSLAASFASPRSSSHPSCSASSPAHMKADDQEVAEVELSDQTDGEEEYRSVSPGPARLRRRSADRLLEERLRRREVREVREARRDWDLDQRDHVDLFLLSLAPALRRLAPEKQSWVRTKIQQLLHEAEFGPSGFQ